MITTSQFQERLIEYLDGELSEAECREVEEYLQAHPGAAELKGDLALLSEAGRSIRESSYPADLLLDANRSLAACLGGRSDDVGSVREAAPLLYGNGSPQRPGPTSAPHRRQRWGPRSIAAALAAAAVLLAGAASQRAAIAEAAGSLLQRIRVSIDGEQWHELERLVIERKETVDGGVIYLTKMPEEGDTLRISFPEQGDTLRVPLSESGTFPAGKMGASSPGVPAQSWGEVKEAVDPKVDTSP